MRFSTVTNAFLFFVKDNYKFRCELLNRLRHSGALNWLSDKAFIRLVYFIFFRKKINLKHPVTFNEKLNWLKINNRKEIYCRMVDKFEVKQYVKEHIGDKYIIESYGVWDTFEDINFNELPNKFVLKCTHDSGSVVICKDKEHFDYKKAREKLKKGLKNNLFYWGREWPYKTVKPRIIAEKYLEDLADNDLKDYKFFCFDGNVKFLKVDFGRFTDHRANYYNLKGELLNIGEFVCPPDPNYKIVFPENFEEMIQLAKKLSTGFPFLRVDLYNVNNSIYFGELTFYPASALSPFINFSSDILLGQYIKLPNE